MLCAAIMTDHWEEVTWDRDSLENLANGSVRLQWLLDGAVAKLSTNDIKDRSIAFLVPMHGGIWTLCVSLSGKSKPCSIKEIFQCITVATKKITFRSLLVMIYNSKQFVLKITTMIVETFFHLFLTLTFFKLLKVYIMYGFVIFS